jgi:glycerol-3-phosphate dehydrogenase
MGREDFDLIVIGGGITGAGIALDAASRGFRVAMVEKSDFASGTSSRSTKLIHGGLRYLGQFRFNLVRESLIERATLHRLAPHLSRPLPFLVPLYTRPVPSPLGRSRLKLKLGLSLYDWLSGAKNIGPHRWLDPAETAALAPKLEQRGLRGAFLFYDCVTDDARLVVEVTKTAARHGAVIANYARVEGLIRNGNRVSGVEAVDSLSAARFSIKSRLVINATGVWVDQVAALGRGRGTGWLRPSKGVHVVFPANKIDVKAAVLIPSLGEQRFLFLVPWQGRVIVGTTDTDYNGDLDALAATSGEVNQLIESAARFFPQAALSSQDIVSCFAGLRPLIGTSDGSPSAISREEKLYESEPGLLSIAGGKLTTYRRMAERVVDLAVRRLGASVGRCNTLQIPLARLDTPPGRLTAELSAAAAESDVPVETAIHLADRYGGNYRRILELAAGAGELKQRICSDLPHIAAEALYSARYEMTMSMDDFLERRTRIALLARDHGESCREQLARLGILPAHGAR